MTVKGGLEAADAETSASAVAICSAINIPTAAAHSRFSRRRRRFEMGGQCSTACSLLSANYGSTSASFKSRKVSLEISGELFLYWHRRRRRRRRRAKLSGGGATRYNIKRDVLNIQSQEQRWVWLFDHL